MLQSLGSAEKRKAQFMDLLAPKSGVGKLLLTSLLRVAFHTMSFFRSPLLAFILFQVYWRRPCSMC
jgi:hypothetical protein